MHLKAARPASFQVDRLPNVMAVVVAVVAVVLAGGHSHADQRNAAAQPTSYAFDRHEIDIGPAVRQTVLTGFLLGGEVADLAVVKVEEDGGFAACASMHSRENPMKVYRGRLKRTRRPRQKAPGRCGWIRGCVPV